MGIKNVEFHADFKSIEKVLKNVPKKAISKNVTEISTFSTFTFYLKKNLGVLIVLFSNFEAKRAKNGTKNQKTY